MTVLCVQMYREIIILCVVFFFFFFQAEDGIRDWSVTGVQTCALPIYPLRKKLAADSYYRFRSADEVQLAARLGVRIDANQIGRASCRERV